jgi:hypothetical protein
MTIALLHCLSLILLGIYLRELSPRLRPMQCGSTGRNAAGNSALTPPPKRTQWHSEIDSPTT